MLNDDIYQRALPAVTDSLPAALATTQPPVTSGEAPTRTLSEHDERHFTEPQQQEYLSMNELLRDVSAIEPPNPSLGSEPPLSITTVVSSIRQDTTPQLVLSAADGRGRASCSPS